ncbi:hypothetical protein [Lactobacillus sp. ESL0228]|uniref:hypothetical protein n=1 Tax=Lactobacillus sp. ESL0228 TaxID=2069352 RepID=UPI000EFDA763|nr:hypothetical protein [Lactobacillus sp. ESL0228]RMC47355.1 hypothetical protein F5ESL0228_07880 [Lactobacillus sp. ESL0228]
MKMRKIISKVAILLLFGISVLSSFNGTIQASDIVPDTKIATTSKTKEDETIDQAWSQKLAKAGYVFRLTKSVYSTLYPDNWIDHQAYSKKYAKKIVAKKMLFKVDQAKSIENGSAVHIISQNGKYRFWANFLTDIDNVNGHKKSLKALINIETKIIIDAHPQAALKQFGKAEKATTKLKGKDRKLARESLKELKQWSKDERYAKIPTLLIGSL